MSEMQVIKRRGRPPKNNSFQPIEGVQEVLSQPLESDVEAGYVKNVDAIAAIRALKAETKRTYLSRAEQLACDFQYTKSKSIECLKEIYPGQPWLWKCDWFFPFAIGGELYMDEPKTIEDAALLAEKETFLRKKGFRYVILKPDHTTYDDVEELAKCGH